MKRPKQSQSKDDLKLIEPLTKLSARHDANNTGVKVITPANVATKRRETFTSGLAQGVNPE